LRVLIGTHSIFGVGIDIPHLDIIFNVCANRGDITTLQALGRSLRKSEGKYDALYLDFIDDCTNFLIKASRSRFNIFKKHGYSPKIIEALK